MTIGTIILAVVAIVIAVNMIPVALTSITASRGNYTGAGQAIIDIVPIVLPLVVLFIGLAAAGIYVMKK